ncbi:MAG: DEAD/DEAH box helicase [Myxococcota bacterium]
MRLDEAGAVVELSGSCACPVGHRCKHMAAVASVLWDRLCPDPDAAAARVREEVVDWARGLAERGGAANEVPTRTRSRRELRFIVDVDGDGIAPPVVHTVAVTPSKSGVLRERAVDLDAEARGSNRSSGGWIAVEDRLLYHELRLRERQSYGYGHVSPRLPADETGPELLARLAASGRAHLDRVRGPALQWASPRRAEVGWRLDHRGTQSPALLGLPPGTTILSLRPPHWVDPKTGRCGPVLTDLSPAVAQALARAPTLPAEAADGSDWAQWPPASGIPRPRRLTVQHLPPVAPTPRLVLRSDGPGHAWAELSFRYGLAVCDPDEPHAHASIVSEGSTVLRVPRDRAAEAALAERLIDAGLQTTETLEANPEGRWPSRWVFDLDGDQTATDDAWLSFAADAKDSLAAQGWLVEPERGFGYALSSVDAWYAEVDELSGGDWFALSVGVEIDGVRVGVLPAVKRALTKGEFGVHIPDRGVVLDLGDGRRVRMPAERLRTIVSVLLELFGNRPLDGERRLRLPRAAASRLVEIDPGSDLRWYGPARLRSLGRRLAEAAARDVPPVQAPPTLRATLRDYQRAGLSWLQFLRTHALGGVLADDMGLGKTMQTLAHIVLEQHEGRLDRPCLVVAPTSVLPVWRDETRRFAPSLSLHVHHGPRRGKDTDRLEAADVVVTSYALLLRDAALLSSLDWSLVVLDEAHAIKNPAAKVSAAARRLNARCRLCLTGTPVENNLSELWAEIDFVMPGLLGTPARFATVFANPIEQDGDTERQQALVARLAPFMLRRTKDDVLPQLPSKTTQVRYAELGRAQRDLYEAVRLAVDTDVRATIDDKGLARSQLGVLQALLKLREVCCHPSLVPYPAARKVKASAKLDLLLSLVDELSAAGRRIVVFSQFTRMLTIIGEALDARGVAWVKLTGRTRKRDAVIAEFAAGDMPVFLVSLKAGGTGIDLTAADTVIHFDPWWNPAAQDQATDRTHRIGQTRPVLVLSLVARGTVEERILALQADKRALADGVLSAAAQRGRGRGRGLSEQELQALLAPLSG